MSGVLGYPRVTPRLLVSTGAREAAASQVAATSLLARTRWEVAAVPLVGRLFWGPPSPAVRAAWGSALQLLDVPDQPVVGFLSDPGPHQKLVLVPELGRTVVKVAVGPRADEIIDRERTCLALLEDTCWRALGPRLLRSSPSVISGRAVLVMERLAGRHPGWDDSDAHRELLCALRCDGKGLHHGDVTPWNVLRKQAGGLVLVDWESADLGVDRDPLCGVLDFVLRGAVVARARRSRVARVLKRAAAIAGRTGDAAGLVAMYRDYRLQVERTSDGRLDTLGRSAERLLAACLSREGLT